MVKTQPPPMLRCLRCGWSGSQGLLLPVPWLPADALERIAVCPHCKIIQEEQSAEE